jgi:hypothetical protein
LGGLDECYTHAISDTGSGDRIRPFGLIYAFWLIDSAWAIRNNSGVTGAFVFHGQAGVDEITGIKTYGAASRLPVILKCRQGLRARFIRLL